MGDVQALASRLGFVGSLAPTPYPGTTREVWLTGDVVFRICRDPYQAHTVYREVFASSAARKAGVPTPELLAFDDSRELVNGWVTVYRRVQGVPYSKFKPEPKRDERIAIDVGSWLALLHAVEVPTDSAHLLANAFPFPLPDPVPPTFGHLLSIPEPSNARLLHWDVHPDNVLVNASTGQAVGLIDWGDAGIGDSALDLGFFPPDLVPSLMEGYIASGAQLDVNTTGRILREMVARALAWQSDSLDDDRPRYPRGWMQGRLLVEMLKGPSGARFKSWMPVAMVDWVHSARFG